MSEKTIYELNSKYDEIKKNIHPSVIYLSSIDKNKENEIIIDCSTLQRGKWGSNTNWICNKAKIIAVRIIIDRLPIQQNEYEFRFCDSFLKFLMFNNIDKQKKYHILFTKITNKIYKIKEIKE